MTTTMKRCPGCGQTKTTDEFGKNASMNDGKHHYCKPCSNQSSKNYYRKHNIVKPRGVRRKENHKHDLVVKYGQAVADALETF